MDSLDQYGHPLVPRPDSPKQGPNVTLALTFAGLLATMLFVKPAIQPQLFEFVIFILSASLGMVVFCGFLGPTIKRAWLARKQKQREQTAVAHLSADFRALVEEFFDFIDPMRGNYIANAIEQWKRSAEFCYLPRLDLQYVREAYRHVQDRLRTFNGNSKEFCRIVSEFEASLKLHHEAAVCMPLDALQQFPIDKLTSSDRENYRTSKRKYEGFMERYQTFAKKLNAAFGRKASDISFRDLREL